MECIESNAAGIDVGVREIFVAVPPERDAQPVRCFPTFTADLRAMAAWLVQCGITGPSGMAIVEAIVAAERDPDRLAELCHRGVRSSRETVVKSLVGNYRSERLFTLKQSLIACRHYQEPIADCDQEIERLMRLLNGKIEPLRKGPLPPPDPRLQKRCKKQFHFAMGPELDRIFGVDMTAIPVSVVHRLCRPAGNETRCPAWLPSGHRLSVLAARVGPQSCRLFCWTSVLALS